MQMTWRYQRTKFADLQSKGWVVVPWEYGKPNQEEVLSWLNNNGSGQYSFHQERNKQNWALSFEDQNSAKLFVDTFGDN